MDTQYTMCVFVVFFGVINLTTVAANLRCLECTHISYNRTYNFDGVRNVYTILNSKFNPACAQADPQNRQQADATYQQWLLQQQQQGGFGNTVTGGYAVGETICPAFSNENRCSYISGDVIIYLQTYNAEMKLNMHVRNCITQSSMMENRCYDRNTNVGYNEVKQFFQEELSFLSPDLEVRSFIGQQCLCQFDLCKPIVSGFPRVLMSSLSLTLVVVGGWLLLLIT